MQNFKENALLQCNFVDFLLKRPGYTQFYTHDVGDSELERGISSTQNLIFYIRENPTYNNNMSSERPKNEIILL